MYLQIIEWVFENYEKLILKIVNLILIINSLCYSFHKVNLSFQSSYIKAIFLFCFWSIVWTLCKGFKKSCSKTLYLRKYLYHFAYIKLHIMLIAWCVSNALNICSVGWNVQFGMYSIIFTQKTRLIIFWLKVPYSQITVLSSGKSY